MIGEALYHILTNTPAFTAIAGNKVFPLRVAQGVALPAVTYQKISGGQNACRSEQMKPYRVQLSVFSARYEQQEAIAAAIREALDGYQDSELSAEFLTETDLYEEGAEVYHLAIDYNITIKK